MDLDKIGGDDIQYYMLECDMGASSLSEAVAWTEITNINNGLKYSFT